MSTVPKELDLYNRGILHCLALMLAFVEKCFEEVCDGPMLQKLDVERGMSKMIGCRYNQ